MNRLDNASKINNSKYLSYVFKLPAESLIIKPAIGGHMAYDHLLIDTPLDKLFAKIHNPSKFTDPIREKHSLNYLKKEQLYLEHLRANKYTHVPSRSNLLNNTTLIMDAFRVEEQWLWRAPKNKKQRHQYITDIINALNKLNQIKKPSTKYQKSIKPTYETLWLEGWDSINDEIIVNIQNKIIASTNNIDEFQRTETIKLLDNLDNIRRMAKKINKPKNLVLSHNDARQSNIAWHRKEGVKIIDWSWADLAPKNADSTMFLIDLSKNGYEVNEYILEHFNKDHAIVMIGFWLAHSLHKSRDDSNTIRIQQIASAVAAYRIIRSLK